MQDPLVRRLGLVALSLLALRVAQAQDLERPPSLDSFRPTLDSV